MGNREEEIVELFTKLMERIVFRIEDIEFEGDRIGRDIFIIEFIGKNGPCTLKEIWQTIQLPASTTSRRVDELVQTGYVIREPSKSDRRKIELRLSEKGEALQWMFIKHRVQNVKKFLKSFKQTEIKSFLEILRKIVDNHEVLIPWESLPSE